MALTILAEQQDGLLTLTFNRPEKRNALNTETYLALTDALRQAARDEEVHVLLLQGQAECFTAGNDIADFIALGKDGKSHFFTDYNEHLKFINSGEYQPIYS